MSKLHKKIEINQLILLDLIILDFPSRFADLTTDFPVSG